jgi:archaellum component FlaG (FlaF/FlaG flagellin family)
MSMQNESVEKAANQTYDRLIRESGSESFGFAAHTIARQIEGYTEDRHREFVSKAAELILLRMIAIERRSRA